MDPPSFIHEYLYSYYSNIKKPTSQENCGPMIKKIPKGLNCYSIFGDVFGDVVQNIHKCIYNEFGS
jgi:hypothetical protein